MNGYAFKPESWAETGDEIIRIQNLTSDDPAKRNYFDGAIETKYRIERGDFLISWSATLGFFVWQREDAWLNQHIFKVDVNESVVRREYFAWLASWFLSQLEERSHGSTMQHLTKSKFGGFDLILPPLRLQIVIADWLELETARIDTLIDKQKRLIELLNEKRQAVISQAVTKGLEPDVQMKDSGVEWLGEVPAHWEVLPLKRLCNLASGSTPNTEMQGRYYASQECGYPWVRTMDLIDGEIFDTPVHITNLALEETACCIVQSGAVLVSMYGGSGSVGKASLLAVPSALNQAICALTPGSRVQSDFLFRFMQFHRPVWMAGAESARKDPNIGQERIGSAFLAVPPIEEQKRIVRKIEKETSGIRTADERTQRMIRLLEERRTALITAAVTGQIDVTNYELGNVEPTEQEAHPA